MRNFGFFFFLNLIKVGSGRVSIKKCDSSFRISVIIIGGVFVYIFFYFFMFGN